MAADDEMEPEAEIGEFEVGDQVKHPKWGVGTILFKSGSGENAKAIVVFPEEGQKKLLVKKARLRKVQ
jgi:DNA helicase-2/ATP-dependent DNA helicase PcrA